MRVAAIECSLPDLGSQGYLMHADSVDPPLSEKVPSCRQDALTMLCSIASLMPRA
jgi:hypothetical protein